MAEAKVLDLGNGYFLINFAKESDYQRALLVEPWTIKGSYLLVEPWTLEFDPSVTEVGLMVWVQLPNHNHSSICCAD